MDLKYSTKEEWTRKAQEVVLYFDAADAHKLLRNWTVVLGSKITDKQEDVTAESLRKNLLFTAFALIPTELAKLVLKEYLLDFLKNSEELLDPMEKIESRIKVAGYGAYDQEREMMKKAVSENKEMIGKFPVNEWIKRFEKITQPGDQNVINTFFMKDSEVANLGKNDQVLLKILVSGYEKWLYGSVISVFDVAAMNKGGRASQGIRRTSGANEGDGTSDTVISLPLLQALSKYENLGNQLITEERIKVKSQPEPVRPSLLYWLKYYRDELGVGHHDNVQRGGLLFRSENGKKLSAAERERINLILKSVEENFPLAIDTERQEIVFPAFQGVLMGEPPPRLGEAGREVPPVATSPSQGTRPATVAAFAPAEARPPAPTDYATGGLRIGRSAPSGVSAERAPRSAEIGSVNFSTTHVFPAEREAAEHRAAVPSPQAPRPMLRPAEVPRPAPQFVPPPAPKRAVQQPNPFRIDPVSLGADERDE